MAFDARTGKLVLFGGYLTRGASHEFGDPLGDTWTWDGTHWSPVQPASSPVARNDASMAYDAARGVVLMHGGLLANYMFVNDTWTWDGARWTLKSPSQSPPDAGGSQPICWDAKHQVVLLFDATARSIHFPLSGGAAGGSELNQTWAWDGTGWTQLHSNGAPSGHGAQPAGMTCDASRNSAVFFGHVNGKPTTWTFDGSVWTQAPTTTGSASTDFSLAPDDARSVVVLFGENGDTWAWNGAVWTPQNPLHSPPPRRRASMSYDSVHRVIVLFGGATGDAAALRELNDTWTWNGSDWTKVG